LFRLKVIQEFHAYAVVKTFCQFLGANMTPKNLFANIETPKGASLRKSASIEALWSWWPSQTTVIRKADEKIFISEIYYQLGCHRA
jgi:hypothetical protein